MVKQSSEYLHHMFFWKNKEIFFWIPLLFRAKLCHVFIIACDKEYLTRVLLNKLR